MLRTYCKIIGTRDHDYTGNTMGQGNSQEMTVFSGGTRVPFAEDAIRKSREIFQLYGAKTAYSTGCFSSAMRVVEGQAFVCYGISQKQSLGRDAQFTQWFVTPREELLNGDAFRQEVLCHDFINEEVIHRPTQPSPQEIFSATEQPRCEVNELDELRLKTLMRAASLLCGDRRVLLIERRNVYRQDYFRPLLRELFELIPAGHRYQIDVTTGRNEDDIERLGMAQLIVTDRFVNSPDRQVLRLDADENIQLTSGEMRWAHLTNLERDRLSEYVGGPNITIQTEYNRLMECMDDEKSFWWESSQYDKSFQTLEALLKRHKSTPILGLPEINQKFCDRMPALLNMSEGFEEYYFDLMLNKEISSDSRKWCLSYIENELRKFGLSDDAYTQIETNYKTYDQTLREVTALRAETARQREKRKSEASALLAFIQQAGAGLFQRIQSLIAPNTDAQPRETSGSQEPTRA